MTRTESDCQCGHGIGCHGSRDGTLGATPCACGCPKFVAAIPDWTADDLTCEACGHVNTARRAYYWGTCEECGGIKGEEKATPLKVAGAWARGEVWA